MKGKEILIFLFFLALAGIFWLLTTLNDSFEQEVRLPVRYVNVPKDVVITSGETDTLRVTVRDKGLSLVTYLYKHDMQPVDIDFRRYMLADGSGQVPRNDLLRLSASRLPASATPVSVKPETEVFYYNYGERKRVPVVVKGTVEPGQLYFIADTLSSADSVTIYASREKLDSIHCVYTQPLRQVGFTDSFVVTTALQRITGVKMVPDEVKLSFITDMRTDVTIDGIPVQGEHMPPGKVLRTFPARVSVRFVTGIKNYQGMQASDFTVVADYDEFSQDSTAVCRVYLHSHPAGIERPRVVPDRVEYLIEEHR